MPAINSVQGDTNVDNNFQCQSIAWANKVIKPIEKNVYVEKRDGLPIYGVVVSAVSTLSR
jgi:hypothetical protein